MLKDDIKRCFIPIKIYLEALCCWPYNRSAFIKFCAWFIFSNMLIAEIFHAAYVVTNIDDVGGAVGASATVITSFEALVRMYILLTKQDFIKEILLKVSKQFWPFQAISNVDTRNQLRSGVILSISLPFIYLTCATISTGGYVFMSLRSYQLVYISVFPFDWSKRFVYEIIYFWQYIINWYNIFMINVFDCFFVSIVAICTAQFVILQEALRVIFDEKSRRQRRIIFGMKGGYMTNREVLLKCLEQHKMLLSICTDLETALQRATLIQLAVSVNASCSACLMMTIDYSQAAKMLSFGIAHLIQLFYYCDVCQKLSTESEQLGDAIYESSWHLEYDRDIRRTLILMMQRSQRKVQMTAVGVMALNLSTFVRCFSC
uniref:Odorant receptor n=1 Tax=Protaetia brevitarsis TaxID=348688 RepID=A0A411HRC4_PROBE|nr:odorant receptor [Protaetia brevitarsis]